MTNSHTQQERLAYIAGLFDGEGSFSIQVMEKQHGLNFGPKMSMSLTYGADEPFDLMVEELGGTIYTVENDNSFRWSLGKRLEIMYAANLLLPHLRLKREVCGRFIHALSLFPENSRKGIDLYHGNRGWSIEDEITVAAIALTLNPGSGVRIQKNYEKLDRICTDRSAKMEDVLKKIEGEIR